MIASATPAGQLATPDSPWLGLRSFTENAHEYFFGRRGELEDLYERIVDKPLTILFGQSGLGKSSLVQAALMPRLRKDGFLPVLVRFDHDADAAPLEDQLLQLLVGALVESGYASHADALQEAMRANAATGPETAALVWLIFHDPAMGFIPKPGGPRDSLLRPVFLIDQFEEIFTLGDRVARRPVSAGFRDTLACLVENRPPASLRALLEQDDDLAERLDYQARHVRVLLSLREDFLHVLERWRRSMPSLMENRLELRMLSGAQAFEAVVRPGQLRPTMPPIIPDEVGQAIVRFVAGAANDVPLEEIDAVPPLLSLVCTELNAQRLLSGEPQITRAQFEGHSTDILTSFYLRSFEPATYGAALEGVPDAPLVLKGLRCLIEDRLLSPDGFRESIAFDTIHRDLSKTADAESAKTALDQIVERRLLTVEERGGVRRLELAHDVLTSVVKLSRDERHEVEELARARSEQERAQAETARLAKERNRLKRLAVVASCLAIVALAGGIVGWVGFRQSRNAAERALEAKNQAQMGFESAWNGLSALYDDYTAGTLENTPGISVKQANLLKSKLRGHLLDELRKLHQEQPDHRGTIHYIARLLLDEVQEAIFDREYTRAKRNLDEALLWCEQQPITTVAEAETFADILLQEARLPTYTGENNRAKAFAASHLSKLRELAAKWPQSWRLAYLAIRIQNVQFWDDAKRSDQSDLADRLDGIIVRSDHHFDPTLWRFIIKGDSYRGEGKFNPNEADYSLLGDLVVFFREHIAQRTDYTLIQLEIAADELDSMILFTQDKFSKPSQTATVEVRRRILVEFEKSMTILETRLPKSAVVYGARADLLRLQQNSIKDGISTRSPDELRAATERHRIASAALGVGSSVADVIAPAFKAYTADQATEASKSSDLATVQNSMRDFMSLDLGAVDTVLQNSDITTSLDKLKKDDPLLSIHHQMIDQYLSLYRAASRDARSAFIESFASAARSMLDAWFASAQYPQIVHFWQDCYEGLPIATFTSGDKEALVSELKVCIKSLLKTKQTADGKRLLNEGLALCDAILKERPWDWYVKDSYAGMCFEAAAELRESGDKALAQQMLRRGWSVFKKMYGSDIDLDRYPDLPLKGEVPKEAPPQDIEFFEQFVTNLPAEKKKKNTGMERFTIPCDFSGTKYPFFVYILHGKNGYAELLDQFRWVKEIRGGTVPKEVADSFERLHKIAVENNVDFAELTVYALDSAAEDAKKAGTKQPADKTSDQSKAKEGSERPAETKPPKNAATPGPDTAGGKATPIPSDDQWVAVPLLGKDSSGNELYGFLKIKSAKVQSFRTAIRSGNGVTLADYGEIFASGRGQPTAEVRKEIAAKYKIEEPVELPPAKALTPQEHFQAALDGLKKAESAFAASATEQNKIALAYANLSASDAGLFVQRWTEVEAFARKSFELKSANPAAYANLAAALLFEGNYAEALKIYREHWNDPINGGAVSEAAYADFDHLEKAGITHPDVARLKADLPKPAPKPAAATPPSGDTDDTQKK